MGEVMRMVIGLDLGRRDARRARPAGTGRAPALVRPLGVLLMLAACVVKPGSPDQGGSAATTDGNSTAVTTDGVLTVDHATSTTSTTSATGSATSTITTTGGPSFVCPPAPCTGEAECPGELTCIDPMEDFDVEGSAQKYCFPPVDSNADLCDVYAQDCAPGFKCVHQLYDGTEPGCVPLQENATPPDTACEKLPACLVDEYGNGIYPDTCDLGSQCFFGTCRQFCTPDYECPAGHACNHARVSLWCIKTCDPLAKECGPNRICYPDSNVFFCSEPIPDSFPALAHLFEPCEAWGCADGLTCADKNAALECQGVELGCCVPFCDLGAPLGAPSCPGEGQNCLAWPWEFDPKPEFEHIGYCSVPQ